MAKKTGKELNDYVGKNALLASSNRAADSTLVFKVLIQEVRRAYGRAEAKVTPLCGSGSAWVNLENLTVEERY